METKPPAEQSVKGEKSQAPAEPAGKLKYEFLQLHKRDSREYSKQNIDKMPPNVFISRFEDNILTDFQIGSTSNYHAAFIELSTDISILWENMTLYKLPQSFYHIAESMQYLTRLQFFLKHCIENEYFDKEENPNKKFHHQFCFWGLGDETFEQVLKGISESYIIVKNALYTVWGKDNEMHDFLNFFSLLYNFYSSCNDYLLNPENN